MCDLLYSIRGSFGYSLKRGVRSPEELKGIILDPKDAYCRCLAFSHNGSYFAYCDSSRTVLVETTSGRECFAANLGKTQSIMFSPKDRYMITYEPYVIYGSRINPDGSVKTPNPNLRIWSIPDGTILTTIIAEKQDSWRPHFTEDESLMLRLHGSEVLFFKNRNFEKPANKVVVKQIASLTVSPGSVPHVACFIPSKNQPALIQLRSLSDSLEMLFTKTSFNCERCAMNWNNKGNALLVTASVDVDKSNQSYYGVSHIYCMLTKTYGDCFNVHLSKEGPVHCVQWAPNSKEFCVCYGFMPSKITIFNTRGDTVWELGEGHRNEVHYNPQSTILVTCGFGNIASGKMEFWNLETRKEISQFCVPHTTHFQWAPDGQHLCTSTTAPRLRTDNGYRIWTYRGELIHEHLYEREELWEVVWRPCTAYNKFQIEELSRGQLEVNSKRLVDGKIKSPFDNLPKGAITQSARYIPPHLRGKNQQNNKGEHKETGAGKDSLSPRTEEAEHEKKMKALNRKLEDIRKLKEKKESGQKLELNQLEKICSEEKLMEELEQLKLGMANS